MVAEQIELVTWVIYTYWVSEGCASEERLDVGGLMMDNKLQRLESCHAQMHATYEPVCIGVARPSFLSEGVYDAEWYVKIAKAKQGCTS